MDWNLFSRTLEILGEVLLGVTILNVHFHVMKEHKIDKDVLKQMKLEQVLGILGVCLIILGFLIEVFIY